MTLSRIRIAVLFATMAALAAVFAACGGGGSSDEDPQSVIDNATLAGVESGTVDLQLGIKSTGDEGGDIKASLSGPFQAGEKGELPQLAFDVKANGEAGGESIDFEGGLTLLSDRAFVAYKGTEYEVDPTTFGFVKSAFEQAQQAGGGESGDTTGCQEAAADLEVGQFVDNLTNEGSADVDGTGTTKVSGDLKVDGALDAIIELTKDPACSSQLEAAGDLPLDELESAKDEVSGAVKKAHADVYVGDDDIVRKLGAELTVEPQDSNEKVEIEFELTLGEVNEEQEISAPANAKPLEGLFQELGVNPLELLEAGSSGDLGGLLEGLTGGDEGGSSEGSGGGSSQQEYVECLQEAETPTDLQKCANLLQ
ncbi:MAG TPA: hypothetical protein VMS11_11475 [Solirubrobacterales bacterium]|nr:hypothetical protein [Solirubrobacterales bacterium]